MTLIELHEILGERMNNLCNVDLSGEELAIALKKAKAENAYAHNIIRGAEQIYKWKDAVGELNGDLSKKIAG